MKIGILGSGDVARVIGTGLAGRAGVVGYVLISIATYLRSIEFGE